jgi:SecD/SecF fusion protein
LALTLRSKSFLFLFLVIGLTVISAILYNVRPYQYGLDIKGGVRLTYQMDTSKLSAEQKADLEGVRSRILTVLVNRAIGAFGVAEPIVVAKGDDQFVIELPGYTNTNEARSIIGTSARIELYHAKTVVNEKKAYLPYTIADESRDSEDPVVSFKRTSGPGDVIKPGTPEYANIVKSWTLILAGDDLASATAEPTGDSYRPSMSFAPKGADKMERWSRQYMNSRENIAAVLDGKVLSVASLQDNQILTSNAQITGTFKPKYVTRLVDLLNAGSLPVDLVELGSETVDPTIGNQALDMMVKAGYVAFGIIALFLIIYYAFPGFMALIALVLYVLFTITAMKLLGATFSLAAVAGLILSVGMAVDANILVFERFKEEMKSGRELVTALELGFKRALPAIVDSNVCTILTSLVLASIGTGPVKGFATSLIIGVLISLFTAITVTRSLLMFLVGSGIGTNPKLYALERNWFGEDFEKNADTNPIPVLKRNRLWFAISIATVVIGLPFIWPLNGLKGNVEFRGGYEAQLRIGSQQVTPAQLSERLEKADIKGANVKFGGEGNARVAIITVARDGALKDVPEPEAIDKIATAAGFTKADVKGSASVGPAIQREMIQNAIIGVLVSSALITFYLTMRFGFGLGGFAVGIKFGFSAIGALLHDVLVVLGITAVFGWLQGWEVSALFITSMLTVIGFSVHDTIVIFDRIRENLRRPQPDEDLEHLINRSISQSFARSLNTSMTVIATLVVMMVIGTTTPDLKLFCVTMLAGILSGTYSSIFNASPILFIWDRMTVKRKGEEAGLMGLARAELKRQRAVIAGINPRPATAPAASTPSAPTAPGTGRSYGQVRRRNSAVDRSKTEIEDL